jgi:ditrans,polycis-polyprenyl diphosphate synthase
MSAVQRSAWSITTFGKNKAEDFLVAILTAGPMPRHIAFHTDGNRRYARRNGMTLEQGYEAGFASIKRVSRGHRRFTNVAH